VNVSCPAGTLVGLETGAIEAVGGVVSIVKLVVAPVAGHCPVRR